MRRCLAEIAFTIKKIAFANFIFAKVFLVSGEMLTLFFLIYIEFPSSPCTRATRVLTRCDAIGNGLQDSCHPRVFLSPCFFGPLFINFLEKLYNFCSKKLFVCLLNNTRCLVLTRWQECKGGDRTPATYYPMIHRALAIGDRSVRRFRNLMGAPDS